MSSHFISLVGRPNVGKSTIFNRLVGKKKAITSSQSGITRDRNYDKVEWEGKFFTLIDTGGFTKFKNSKLEEDIVEQMEVALEESQIILFVVDCKQGLMEEDIVLCEKIRKYNKPTFVVANKADNAKEELQSSVFYELGLCQKVYPISASHGSGTGDLLDAVIEKLYSGSSNKESIESEEDKNSTKEQSIPRIALIGRPNVGKSTLLNNLIDTKRSITAPTPHTTRDTTDTLYTKFGKKLILTDTAGIYKKRSSQEAIEFYSLIRSVRAIQNSDVVVLLITVDDGLTKQDMHIINLVQRHKKGLLLLVNKWDLAPEYPELLDAKNYRKNLQAILGNLSHIPILFTSGLHKKKIYQSIEVALDIHSRRSKKIQTSHFTRFILQKVAITPPKLVKGKMVKINYAMQLPLPSPTFALFCNLPQYVEPNYKRFLEKKIREEYLFQGVPITLVFKKK